MNQLERVACPFCGSIDSGRYDRFSHRFVCMNSERPRACEVVEYKAFVEEVNSQTDDYFARLSGLAPGSSEAEIREMSWALFSGQLDPYRCLELMVLWNEYFARPPVGRDQVIQIVNSVAGDVLSRKI